MNSRPKTLVILTPAFPADESPVNWVTTQQLFVRTLQEQFPGLKIELLTFYYPYETSAYEWHGIPVTPFNGTWRRKLRRFMFWRSIWRKMAIIRKENDVIGLFSFWCGECALIGHYFGRWHGIRHLCWLCGQDARKSNKLVKFIRPRPDELIAMSDFLVVEFERNHGIHPRYMIPNAIGPEEFVVPPPPTGLSAAAGVISRDIDILGVGTLSPFKRFDLLVEIIRSLQPSFPAIRGLHCGEGSEKARILGEIRDTRLEGRLSLLGETPHRDVLALMQRTKVFLHTSDYEGFGVVCLEALHAGAHVISFIKPMEREIPHWHIVDTVEAMTRLAGKLLGSRDTAYTPVTPYHMEDTVRSVMLLFGIRHEPA